MIDIYDFTIFVARLISRPNALDKSPKRGRMAFVYGDLSLLATG